MFYGLEVLDWSQYQVHLIDDDDGNGNGNPKKRFKVLDSSNNESRSKVNDVNDNDNDNDNDVNINDNKPNVSVKKKHKKKNKEKKESKKNLDEKRVENKHKDKHTQKDKMNASMMIVSDDHWQSVQQQWCAASGGAILQPKLCQSLAGLGFDQPTPIQAATLSATILGRRNLVGAAPTGSGKTLAFLLPILQTLLEQHSTTSAAPAVRALIVTPTRELAQQIHVECDKLMKDQCVMLVGGIAQVKQQRLLHTKRPPIIIGTPGRLWAMMSSQEQDHLQDLSQIQFLVLDEADRMTQDHAFPQLVQLLDCIHQANHQTNEKDMDMDMEEEDSDEDEHSETLQGLPGIRGEAHTSMLTPQVLQQIEQQRNTTQPEESTSKEVPDEEFTKQTIYHDDEPSNENENEKELLFPDNNDDTKQRTIHRQTFIYSATLTLPFTSTNTPKKAPSNNKRKRKKIPLEGGLAEILEKAHAMGETKVVDLSSSSSSSSKDNGTTSRLSNNNNKNGVKLPPGLRLEQIQCTQRHKDSHLYAYLMTTQQGSSGPALVFCNSIAAVRRVGTTLQTLGLSVRILHAHMQQRARFKAVESLNTDKGSGSRAVVVCTDVAARGLDIPSVATVIHYDVARAVDTFVHRAGRTARGMGEGAIGASLSLIAPAEDKAQSKIFHALQVKFAKVALDGRLLSSAQERVNLATKIFVAAEKERKSQSQNQWFLEKAKEAELELDDDMLEDEGATTAAEKNEVQQARSARTRLQQLLATPMTTQRFGKFLSTNSAVKNQEIKQIKSATISDSR